MAELTARALARRAGELLCCGYPSPGAPPEEFLDRVARRQIGAVIFFSRNAPSLEAVEEATRGLRDAGGDDLIIAIDEEGGPVQRLPEPWPRLPSAMALAAGAQADEVEMLGRLLGQALRALGITQNYAPVLDVNVNAQNPIIGPRSFGDRPERVAVLGAAMARGLQTGGVLATGKHFPGHGDTDVDSHLGLPVMTHDRTRLRQVELVPFVAAVRSGIASLMTAHIALPAVCEEPDRPATLSHAVLTGLVRDELGFQGLLVTDCLEMAAIAHTVGAPTGAVMAVAAGADQVLVSHTASVQEACRQRLEKAIMDGEVSSHRVEEALGRISTARARVREAHPPTSRLKAVAALREMAERLAERGVYRASGTSRPVPSEVWCVVPKRAEGKGEAADRWNALLVPAGETVRTSLEALVDRGPVHFVQVGPEGGAITSCPADAEVVFAVPSLRQRPGWLATWQSFSGRKQALILEDAYDAARLTGADQIVQCGDPTGPAVRWALNVLFGRAESKGHAPIAWQTAEKKGFLSPAGFVAREGPPDVVARPDED